MGNCRHKIKVLDINLGEGGGGGSGHKWLVYKGVINYADQSFVTTPQSGNQLLVQGHARDPQPENQSPRRSPAQWALVTNDLDHAERSQILWHSLTYLMNSFLIIFFK